MPLNRFVIQKTISSNVRMYSIDLLLINGTWIPFSNEKWTEKTQNCIYKLQSVIYFVCAALIYSVFFLLMWHYRDFFRLKCNKSKHYHFIDSDIRSTIEIAQYFLCLHFSFRHCALFFQLMQFRSRNIWYGSTYFCLLVGYLIAFNHMHCAHLMIVPHDRWSNAHIFESATIFWHKFFIFGRKTIYQRSI